MIKKLALFSVCMLVASCSYNYAEDEEYAHIKKTEIVCKPIKVEQFDIHKSNDVSVQTTSKCLFIKTESVQISPRKVLERQKLEAMLQSSSHEETLPNQNTAQ